MTVQRHASRIVTGYLLSLFHREPEIAKTDDCIQLKGGVYQRWPFILVGTVVAMAALSFIGIGLLTQSNAGPQVTIVLSIMGALFFFLATTVYRLAFVESTARIGRTDYQIVQPGLLKTRRTFNYSTSPPPIVSVLRNYKWYLCVIGPSEWSSHTIAAFKSKEGAEAFVNDVKAVVGEISPESRFQTDWLELI